MDTKITGSTSRASTPLDRFPTAPHTSTESESLFRAPLPSFFAALAFVAMRRPDGTGEQFSTASQAAQGASATIELSPGVRNLIIAKAGEQAVKFIDDHGREISQAGFSSDDVVFFALRGGVPSLLGMLENHRELEAQGFSREQIRKIGGRRGGTIGLRAALRNFRQLSEAGFSHQDIVSIASKPGCDASFHKVAEMQKDLRASGFTVENIVSLASHALAINGFVQMAAAHKRLRAAGFSAQHIVDMASKKNAAVLDKVLEVHEEFLAAGFTPHEIASMAMRPGAAKGMDQALVERRRTRGEAASLPTPTDRNPKRKWAGTFLQDQRNGADPSDAASSLPAVGGPTRPPAEPPKEHWRPWE